MFTALKTYIQSHDDAGRTLPLNLQSIGGEVSRATPLRHSTTFTFNSVFNIQQSMIASLCCWIWSFVWCLLPLVGWNNYVLEVNSSNWIDSDTNLLYPQKGIGTSCAPDWYADGNAAKFTITFFIVVLTTLFGILWQWVWVGSKSHHVLFPKWFSANDLMSAQIVKEQHTQMTDLH